MENGEEVLEAKERKEGMEWLSNTKVYILGKTVMLLDTSNYPS